MARIFTALVVALGVFFTSQAMAQDWRGDLDSQDRRHGAWSLYDGEGNLQQFAIYRHGKLNGNVIHYHASGNDYQIIIMVDDTMHGDFEEFFDNEENSTAIKGQHQSGAKSGKWTKWHQNGKVSSVENYFNGSLQGEAIYYYPSGGADEQVEWYRTVYHQGQHHGDFESSHDNSTNSMHEIGGHQNGLKSGLWITYSSLDVQQSLIEYYAGKKHGKAMIGHISGQLAVETTYINDQVDGPYAEFHDNPEHTKKTEGSHVSGTRDGRWKEWHSNGNRASETSYKLGKLTGTAVYYHGYDGSMDYMMEYQNDVPNGAYIKYHFPKPASASGDAESPDNDKNLRAESGRHEDGQRVGEWYWIHPNGETQQHGSYFDGKPSGKWRAYNIKGELATITDYSDGEIVAQQTGCDLEGAYCEDEQ